MRSIVTAFAAATLALVPALAMGDEKKPVLLDGKVSIAVPSAFTELSKEEIAAKYPRQNAPGRSFGNERRTVTFGGALTQQPLKPEQLADAEKGMGDQMAKMIPQLEWIRREIVTINGQRWIHFSMITPAIDTKIRNEMYVTSIQGKAFIINLNATVAEYPNYEQAITAMRQSLRVVTASAPR